MSVHLHWFLPTGGDGRNRWTGTPDTDGGLKRSRITTVSGVRAPDIDYLAQVPSSWVSRPCSPRPGLGARTLAARRLVERAPDAEDGRVAWVRLTPTGADLAERAVRATASAQHEPFRALPTDAAETATAALREVSAAVRDR